MIHHLAEGASAEIRSVIQILDMIRDICKEEDYLQEIGKTIEDDRTLAYTLLGGIGAVSNEVKEIEE
jgi:hypothetical protein